MRHSIKECTQSYMSKTYTTSAEKERLLTQTLNGLFDKIDHYMYIKTHVDWHDVLQHVKKARDATDLDTKHVQSDWSIAKWKNVRRSRMNSTRTDVQYEAIDAEMRLLESIMKHIDQREDTMRPWVRVHDQDEVTLQAQNPSLRETQTADLRKLLRSMQTAPVDG